MTEEQQYQQGMHDAYALMDKTITSAIRRNEGAKTALQIINVFNEFTAHLHYQKSLLDDTLRDWDKPTDGEVFADERKQVEELLKSVFGIELVKGGFHS